MINLSRATDVLDKRGPDSRGVFNDHFVGLGHRRLSIIDTSSDGRQPMVDPSGRYAIIFNGEIFNYPALKQNLLDAGVTFHSQTDTEVLLNLYIIHKEKCLEFLNGFFAFAIYDKEAEELFIARDRIGIKPLLYFMDEDKFIFSSEMKSLIAFGISKEIDNTSLYQYLQLNYIPAPATIFKYVYKLMPGHYMNIRKKKVNIRQYYKIPYAKAQVNPGNLNYEQQKAQLSSLMEDSVKMRLIADVPLGTFLSGGIDSSVISALAARHTNHLNTFSIGYKDEPFFDETNYARLVAKQLKTEHTVFSLSNDDLFEHLHAVLDYIDEPFADSSALPVFILSKETKKRVSVALSGDGADELFAGYSKHSAAYKALHGGKTAQWVVDLLPLWNALPKSRNNPLGNKVRQLQKFAEGMKLSEKERYWKWASLSTEGEARKLLKKDIRDALDRNEADLRKRAILSNITEIGDINELLYTDMQLVLTNDMLTKVDLMSMACGLEVRVPFLDHHVVNFAFSLPADSKINDSMKKRIVQDTFREILPPQLYNRPKHGFEVPLLKWFKTGLKHMIDDLLDEKVIEKQGIFDQDEIRSLKKKLFSSDPGDVHARMWGLIVFQSWWKKNMD
ncbi:MAG: asparagine synthase (glutamine-hydrolyzing) [Bacteroidota bacterium]|nr:asparagine synthase (glutamine-hydrolyzing) [Bacteroidota bacterium]